LPTSYKSLHLAEGNDVQDVLSRRYAEIIGRLNRSRASLPISLTFYIDHVDVPMWLKGQMESPRVYWASRGSGLEVGGYGSAMVFSADSPDTIPDITRRIEDVLAASAPQPHLRLFGGRCFETTSKPDNLWSGFPMLRFDIPQVAISREGTEYFLTIATEVSFNTPLEEISREMNRILNSVSLQEGFDGGDQNATITSREDHPDRAGWNENVLRSLEEINAHRLQKVVLARRTDLTFSRTIDPFSLLRRLKRNNLNCFAFLIEPLPGKAFTGVTPERLFKVEGDTITSEALSGTTGRPQEPFKEWTGEETSLYSEKNLLEHRYVVEDIEKRVDELCESTPTPSGRKTFELGNISHIYSRISGRLRRGVSVGTIISTIHPTPAVGGTPREKALQLVGELEPFDRGWYASPVGIIGQGSAEMAVAIRSAIIESNRISLFAGAGIVDGSTPEAEWCELEHKIAQTIEGLNGGLPWGLLT